VRYTHGNLNYASNHTIVAAEGCPPEILSQQVAIIVPAVNYAGQEYTGILETNRIIAPIMAGFFDMALDMEFPFANVAPASEHNFDDRLLMAASIGHSFNYRTIAGTNRLTFHARGLAFDGNQAGDQGGEHQGFGNPYMRLDEQTGEWISEPEGITWDPNRPGTFYSDHPLVRYMEKQGMFWGGNWKPAEGVVDFQHFGYGEI